MKKRLQEAQDDFQGTKLYFQSKLAKMLTMAEYTIIALREVAHQSNAH